MNEQTPFEPGPEPGPAHPTDRWKPRTRRKRPGAAPGIVHGFEKPPTERIIAGVFKWRGEYRVDVRTCFHGKDGKLRRTRRGVSIPLALLPELETALAALRKAADGLPPEALPDAPE